jgi:2-phospho-L-lactate guanylyltransferase (CobY/MobA/RfbA family)
VLFFARAPREEARRKGLAGAEPLFARAARRVAQAAALAGFDLLVVGGGPPLTGEDGRHLPQRGTGFAERLRNAFADARALGYDRIVAVPGDVPGLEAVVLGAAARALDEGRVVLGPSPDGGVYLLGLPRAALAGILFGVPWQTGAVFTDLLTRTRGQGIPVRVLHALHDVDRPRDLDRIVRQEALEADLLRLVRHLRRRCAPKRSRVVARKGASLRLPVEPLRGPPSLGA